MIWADAVHSVASWAGAVGGAITVVGTAIFGLYFFFRKKKGEADTTDEKARLEADRVRMEQEQAQETYNIKIVRELHQELQNELRQAKKDYTILERSVTKQLIDANNTLHECQQEYAVLAERHRLLESENQSLKAELAALEKRLQAANGGA